MGKNNGGQAKRMGKEIKNKTRFVAKNSLAENLMDPWNTDAVRIPDGGDGASAICTTRASYPIDFNLPDDSGTANRRAEFVLLPFVGQSLYRAALAAARYTSPYMAFATTANLKDRFGWADSDDLSEAQIATSITAAHTVTTSAHCGLPVVPVYKSGSVSRLKAYPHNHGWASTTGDFTIDTGKPIWGIKTAASTDVDFYIACGNTTASNLRVSYYYTDDDLNVQKQNGAWQTGPLLANTPLTIGSVPIDRVILAAVIEANSVDIKIDSFQWALREGVSWEKMDFGSADVASLMAAHPNGFKARTISGGLHVVYESGELYGGNVTGARYGSDYDPFNGVSMRSISAMTALRNTYTGRLNDNFMAPWTPGTKRSYKHFRHVTINDLTWDELNDSSFCKVIVTRENDQAVKLNVIHSFEYLTENLLFNPQPRFAVKGVIRRAMNFVALLPDGFANDGHEETLSKVRKAEVVLRNVIESNPQDASFLMKVNEALSKVEKIFNSPLARTGAAIAAAAFL